LVNILQFSFSLSYTGPNFFYTLSFQKYFICFLSVFVSTQVSDGPNRKSLSDRLGGTLELGP
jgi:hypothetical protein